jgi:NitT/TauT family transport system substrate-binding protein
MNRALATGAATAVLALAAAGCASSSASQTTPGGSSTPVTLRLGFQTNITHAPALIGIEKGIFAKALGPNVKLVLKPYSTGTEEGTALLAGQLDAAYVGPNPTLKAWQTSNGKLIKVISGAASGGAGLVVKKGINTPAQIKGQKIASPSLGNTQDVALRYWLKQQHLTTTQTGGGDVPITPITPNSAAVLQFQSGQIAGGWEPAPYDIEMVQDGGHMLVNEAALWPKGQFVTTNLVVTDAFLAAHRSVVNGLLKGQVQANDYIHSNLSGAEAAANAELAKLLGKGLDPSVLSASFKAITFTDDPIASSLATDAKHAVSVGLLSPVKDLPSLYDLGLLNAQLKAAGQPQVSS